MNSCQPWWPCLGTPAPRASYWHICNVRSSLPLQSPMTADLRGFGMIFPEVTNMLLLIVLMRDNREDLQCKYLLASISFILWIRFFLHLSRYFLINSGSVIKSVVIRWTALFLFQVCHLHMEEKCGTRFVGSGETAGSLIQYWYVDFRPHVHFSEDNLHSMNPICLISVVHTGNSQTVNLPLHG